MSSKKKNNKASQANEQSSSQEPNTPQLVAEEAIKTPLLRDSKFLGLLALYVIVLTGIACARFATLPDARTTAALDKPLRITVFDQIANPSTEVPISAKFETDGIGPINPDKENFSVSLGFVESEELTSLKAARTDDDGMASESLKVPEKVNVYRILAHPLNAIRGPEEAFPNGTLFVIDPSRDILICDIDDTLTKGSKLKAIQGDGDPLPNSASVLSRLAPKFQIVYLTARDESLLPRTRKWLAANSYPSGPVFCRDWKLDNLNKAGSNKNSTLHMLRKQVKNAFVWGIGNNKGDAGAYQNNSMKHVIIGDDELEKADGRHMAKDWKEIEKLFDELGLLLPI